MRIFKPFGNEFELDAYICEQCCFPPCKVCQDPMQKAVQEMREKKTREELKPWTCSVICITFVGAAVLSTAGDGCGVELPTMSAL